MRLRSRRAFIWILALGAVAGLAVPLSPPSGAQITAPWTLGRIDQRFVWSPRDNVVPAIDACNAKRSNTQSAGGTSSPESSEPTCLLRSMRAGGASPEAIAFTRWYYRAPDGEDCFIEHLTKARFGVVSIAEIEMPSRADNNWYYIFVNGKPPVINPDEAFTTQLPWRSNAAFVAIERAHPNAGVFPDEAFIGESARPNGGQRFTLAALIRDGCHACPPVGIVYIGFDFGPQGTAKAPVITAVHRCPSFDARCKGDGFASLPSSRPSVQSSAAKLWTHRKRV